MIISGFQRTLSGCVSILQRDGTSGLNSDIDDMMLMKNCKHIITANSTFSWWAAWLNEHEDAMCIVPAKPFGIKEMIPDNWVKIPV